jgi:hypothetical protein
MQRGLLMNYIKSELINFLILKFVWLMRFPVEIILKYRVFIYSSIQDVGKGLEEQK